VKEKKGSTHTTDTHTHDTHTPPPPPPHPKKKSDLPDDVSLLLGLVKMESVPPYASDLAVDLSFLFMLSR